ncbi:guanine nucleotide-binding protein subunit alpha-15-like [Protopterus annectens]|uniref:guanine nucleotide-binding protein subunit alpha-15-like n=1 Tax=Protopterus annectens TaxID=7888 RepID=UPI001CFB58B3|nr:guanine nucleotide-binding protein subunit alpha-15-like [Protopterus annectens]
MRIIHDQHYSESDRKAFSTGVYDNIMSAMQALIQAMENLNIDYGNKENKHLADLISNVEVNKTFVLDNKYAKTIKDLWEDDGIKRCYDRRNEFHLLDSASYFFTEIDRIAAENYIPTEQDVLRMRVITTGITEYVFPWKKMNLRIVDVGGQRSERIKWTHCLNKVFALIFLASLSEYDQRLEETNEENRMKESIALFHTVVDYKWFQNTSVILFLNKKDILEEKILTSNVVTYFPEFRGHTKSASDARNFIYKLYENEFLKVMAKKKAMKEVVKERSLFRHFTCAVDKDNITKVFNDVKDTVLIKYLDEMGLF